MLNLTGWLTLTRNEYIRIKTVVDKSLGAGYTSKK